MNAIRRNLLFGFLIFAILLPLPGIAGELPDVINYCGMELRLTPGAKKILSAEIDKIQVSKVYFDKMVLRAQKYFPYIEQAFVKHKVPLDLKYLAIQESSLRPNAVSTSNAVGFWQFKAPTAREVGLTVDTKVDERRHIYRSSEGAAIYLSKANFDFTNWVYAVISYYEGPTGAVPHTNPDFFAVKTMVVDEDLHWYAMKAIAHKLAYSEAVKAAKEAKKLPTEVIEMVEVNGDRSLGKVMKDHFLKREGFLSHNPWMLKFGHFPSKRSYNVFVPRITQDIWAEEAPKTEETPLVVISEPEIVEENVPKTEPKPEIEPEVEESETMETPKPSYSPFPVAVSKSTLSPSQYASFPLDKDLHYGIEYIRYRSGTPLSMTAMKLRVSLTDILVWNGLLLGRQPQENQIIYLKKPRKSEFHIVQEGEDLARIAGWHKSSVKKISKKNRFEKGIHQIFVGQKLYLKKKKPKGERMIILVNEKEKDKNKDEEIREEKSKVVGHIDSLETRTREVPKSESEVQEIETKWIQHKVAEGETLWGISQKYQTKVEIIKMINKLPNDDIQVGQVLRILAKQ